MRFQIVLIIVCIVTGQAHGQGKKTYNFSVSTGAGLFHYINTLNSGASNVTENNACFSFRLMWEPEHRISLGIESGYYRIYSLNLASNASSPLSGKASLSAFPFYACVKVRVFPHFYLTGGTGTALLFLEVSSAGNTSSDNSLALANSHFSALYRRPMSDRFEIGGELKFLNFGKTEDYGFALLVEVTYKFRFKSE